MSHSCSPSKLTPSRAGGVSQLQQQGSTPPSGAGALFGSGAGVLASADDGVDEEDDLLAIISQIETESTSLQAEMKKSQAIVQYQTHRLRHFELA